MNSDKKINTARALTAYVNLTLTCCDVLGCLSTHKTYKKIGICIYLVIYARTNIKRFKGYETLQWKKSSTNIRKTVVKHVFYSKTKLAIINFNKSKAKNTMKSKIQ